MQDIQQVQVVRDLRHLTRVDRVAGVIMALTLLGTQALLVWWFFAAWFPELGITWWGLILPIVAVRTVLLSKVKYTWYKTIRKTTK